MKKIIFTLAVIALAAGCNKTDTDGPQPIIFDESGIFVNEDGSVIIQAKIKTTSSETFDEVPVGDVSKALLACVDSNLVASESKKQVKCNNVFILERDGIYYYDGACKLTSTSPLTIKAASGKGERPVIQGIASSTGSIPATFLNCYSTDFNLEGIHINGADAVSGSFSGTRVIQFNTANATMHINDCFCENAQSAFFRMANDGYSFYITNSTFRNTGGTNGINNGRVLDTRGKAGKYVEFKNCVFYGIQGPIVHMMSKAALIDEVIFRNNTLWNCAGCFEHGYPRTVLYENNIIANTGYWNEAFGALPLNDETLVKLGQVYDPSRYGKISHPIFDFELCPTSDYANVKSIIIRNNNFFDTEDLKKIVKDHSKTAAEVEGVGIAGSELIEAGKLVYEKNFSEVLAFSDPSPVGYKYISVYFDDPANNFNQAAPFEGLTYWFSEKEYSFSYPSSSKSATASTTGGPIGASL